MISRTALTVNKYYVVFITLQRRKRFSWACLRNEIDGTRAQRNEQNNRYESNRRAVCSYKLLHNLHAHTRRDSQLYL